MKLNIALHCYKTKYRIVIKLTILCCDYCSSLSTGLSVNMMYLIIKVSNYKWALQPF